MKDFYLAINDSDCDKFNFWKKWLIMNIAILKPLCKFANLHAYVKSFSSSTVNIQAEGGSLLSGRDTVTIDQPQGMQLPEVTSQFYCQLMEAGRSTN